MDTSQHTHIFVLHQYLIVISLKMHSIHLAGTIDFKPLLSSHAIETILYALF